MNQIAFTCSSLASARMVQAVAPSNEIATQSAILPGVQRGLSLTSTGGCPTVAMCAPARVCPARMVRPSRAVVEAVGPPHPRSAAGVGWRDWDVSLPHSSSGPIQWCAPPPCAAYASGLEGLSHEATKLSPPNGCFAATVCDLGGGRGKTSGPAPGLVADVLLHDRLQYRRPLPHEAFPAFRIVTEQIGQSEPACQIERGLYGLPHAGSGLVHAQQFHRDPVRLPADTGLQRSQHRTQGLVRGRGDPQM